jgi:hypothetical protein
MSDSRLAWIFCNANRKGRHGLLHLLREVAALSDSDRAILKALAIAEGY